MKNIADLTPVQANSIIDDRINSIIFFTEEQGHDFIPNVSLNNWFIECPPIGVTTEVQIGQILSYLDTSDIPGKLRWMYFKTYLNGGVPRFRRNQDGDCEMYLMFSQERKAILLSDEKKSHTFDGANELQTIWLLQLQAESNLLLVPSVSVRILINGLLTYNQSLSTLISKMQPNAQIALVNKMFGGFYSLTVEIQYNNPDIKNPITLVYI